MRPFYLRTRLSQTIRFSTFLDSVNMIVWPQWECLRLRKKVLALIRPEQLPRMRKLFRSWKTSSTMPCSAPSRSCASCAASWVLTTFSHGLTASISGPLWMGWWHVKITYEKSDSDIQRRYLLIGRCVWLKELLNYFSLRKAR